MVEATTSQSMTMRTDKDGDVWLIGEQAEAICILRCEMADVIEFLRKAMI